MCSNNGLRLLRYLYLLLPKLLAHHVKVDCTTLLLPLSFVEAGGDELMPSAISKVNPIVRKLGHRLRHLLLESLISAFLFFPMPAAAIPFLCLF